MKLHSKAVLVAVVLIGLLFGAVPASSAATGDYYVISVSENAMPFRIVWQGTDLSTFSYTSTAVPTASGSKSVEYRLEHKNMFGTTLYTLSNSLSWSWNSSGVCTITGRHYHQTSPGNGWTFEHLHENLSGVGTGYCWSKYKAHFHWEGTIPPGIPVDAEAYPGLYVRGNSGGTHSSRPY